MKKYLFMVTAALVLTIQTLSQTIINAGPVSGIWTASGSPYHIMGDINVPAGNTLVIEPGVTVKIYTELSIKVYGQFIAQGTEEDTIYFVPVSSYWKGLQFLNPQDSCFIAYSHFSGFKNKTVNNNNSINGGVIYADNAYITICHSSFLGNEIESQFNYNVYYGKGGAICIENSELEITMCNFISNKINLNEFGDFSGYGGAIYVLNSIGKLSDNIIKSNIINVYNPDMGSACAQGGGIYVESPLIEIQNNVIKNNTCYAYSDVYGYPWQLVYGEADCAGAGIYSQSAFIINNLISENICNSYATGSGYFWIAYAFSSGGGICCGNGCYLKFNTINNNQVIAFGASGSSLCGSGFCADFLPNNPINNSIIYFNIGANQLEGYTSVEYSCIQGGYSGQGNISGNPLFVNPSSGDYHLKQPPCQAQLSPCVDAGDPSTPLFIGTTRTDQICDTSVIDMGYHYPCEFYGPTVVADFHAINPISKANTMVHFIPDCISFLSQITEWKWDFQNDGIIDSNDESPDFNYDDVGNYSIKLIIRGQGMTGEMLTDTLVKENYIHICYFESGFMQDTTDGFVPFSVQFTDTSELINSQIGIYKWDFDNDGFIDSYLQNPEYTFQYPGLYTIKQIIFDTSGFISDTTTKGDLILVKQFEADYIADNTYGELPLTTHFTNTSQTFGTEITQYEWDFDNDGIIDSYEENPTWIFSEPVNYSIKLTLTGLDAGDFITDTLLKENYIQICYFESGFEQDTASGWYPLMIQFNDTSQIINTTISSWQWDFEADGIIDSYLQDPEFVYENIGLYSVKLVITDSSGYIKDTTFKEALINVNGIVADFDAAQGMGYIPFLVYFINTSLSHNVVITGWAWDFQNDGIIDSYEENPSWTYSESGFYSVKLIVTGESTNDLVTDTIIKENFIAANELNAEFHSNKTYGQLPLQINFYDDSYSFPINFGGLNSWQWDFQNDGIIDSYNQNPLWTYSESGIFSVKLISGNSDYGVYDTIIKQDLITICNMSIGFYAQPLNGVNPLEVNFYDTSNIIFTQIGSWKWDFDNDGTFDSYDQNPVWTYFDPGSFSVQCVIIDTSGLIIKSVVKSNYILIIPVGYAENTMMEINDIRIYPNPFTNDLIIEFDFDKPEEVTVQIFDIAFKPVAIITKDEKVSAGKKNWKWGSQTNNSPSGIYYISLQTLSGKQYIKKCIKVE